MKTIINYSFAAILMFFLFNACVKKDDPIPGDTLSLRTLGEETSSITTGSTTTGTTTTGSTTTGGTTTTGGVTNGVLTIWSSTDVINYCGGTIYVYIDNTYAGSLTIGYASNPGCNALYAVSRNLSSGFHTWYAVSEGGDYYWGTASSPRSIDINLSCLTRELIF